MNSTRNQKIHFENQDNVSGMENVPLTLCLPAARASANTPAYVECTGKARNEELISMGSMRHLDKNALIELMERHP